MSLLRKNSIAEKVSAALLAECVIYLPEDGRFVWRVRPAEHFPDGKPSPERRAAMWNGKYAGKPAFTSSCPRGYFRGEVMGSPLYAHRAAFACFYGRWPDGEIDHINRDKSDNRIINLREVSHSENRLNTADCDAARIARAETKLARKPCSLGIRRQGSATWSARVKKGGAERHLGSFGCFGQALNASLSARGVL